MGVSGVLLRGKGGRGALLRFLRVLFVVHSRVPRSGAHRMGHTDHAANGVAYSKM